MTKLKIVTGKPGLEVKYHVDPAHLKVGEGASFLRYLSTHNLHIDVWDGDSLLLLGSLSVPLKVKRALNVVFSVLLVPLLPTILCFIFGGKIQR